MFYFDPFYMLLSIVGLGLVFIPQMLVKNTYSKFSKVLSSNKLTGADIVNKIFSNANIDDVKVEPVKGELTDHYDPSQKVVRLSEANYYGNSIAAVSVAAHEAGHVIQDYTGYYPMKLRAAFFPIAATGQALGPILIMVGLMLRFFMGYGGISDLIALTGVIFYGAIVLFHIITLPVELNASYRAIQILETGGFISTNEKPGAQKVLTAAALTYVATALYALMELLYWVWRIYGSRRD